VNRLEYERAIAWIVRNRGGGNGWPPRSSDTVRVSGWLVVRMVADLWHKSPREVAGDIIEFDRLHENGEVQP
jgi:hypothetical protein